MLKIVNTEWKLFLREPSMVVFAVLFPAILLLVLGAIPALRTPDPNFDNQRFIDAFMSSLVVTALAFLGLNKLPATVATYREKGVLRRFSTTPVHPARLLVAQVLVNLIAGVISIVLLMVVGRAVFDIDLPHHPLWFLVTFLLGMLSLSAIGLLVAAWAPNARSAGGWATVVFMLVMFFGGVYLPRFLLPDFLNVIGAYLPPGVEALQQSWLGAAPDPVHLGVLALVTVAAGTVAAKSFRWE
ncbi:ABC transporter [Saccharothrix sp. NRRL B-16348]|uniref:ABC transporter permease n=1 Tax=Saccharothrix sp. NRRL B-16348 TaxID=1415542 RepID=UPI0006B02151|nr:ABC transporter permease [Saccharothrix sp. NRRL B-16348]KOX23478.1 ABC transporter [Saccharothrix sp. NRRL B-16348]